MWKWWKEFTCTKPSGKIQKEFWVLPKQNFLKGLNSVHWTEMYWKCSEVFNGKLKRDWSDYCNTFSSFKETVLLMGFYQLKGLAWSVVLSGYFMQAPWLPHLPHPISPSTIPGFFYLVEYECAYEHSASWEEAVMNQQEPSVVEVSLDWLIFSLPHDSVVWFLDFMWMIKVFGKVLRKWSKLLLVFPFSVGFQKMI